MLLCHLCGRCKVRIDGSVSKLPGEDTAAIWRGLAHDAQLLHSASCQDDVITSKQVRYCLDTNNTLKLLVDLLHV